MSRFLSLPAWWAPWPPGVIYSIAYIFLGPNVEIIGLQYIEYGVQQKMPKHTNLVKHVGTNLVLTKGINCILQACQYSLGSYLLDFIFFRLQMQEWNVQQAEFWTHFSFSLINILVGQVITLSIMVDSGTPFCATNRRKKQRVRLTSIKRISKKHENESKNKMKNIP